MSCMACKIKGTASQVYNLPSRAKELAALATLGFPYLMQLIGYYVIQYSIGRYGDRSHHGEGGKSSHGRYGRQRVQAYSDSAQRK